MSDVSEKKMTLGEHLEELRRRLMYALAGPAVGFLACFFLLRDRILLFLVRPVYPQWRLFGHDILVVPPVDLKFTLAAPYTGMVTLLFTSLIAGCILTAPWLLYHLWAFVAAGLYPNERRRVISYGVVSIFLFFTGALFFFFVIYPVAISFLYSYADQFNAYLTSRGLPAMLDNDTLLDGYIRFVMIMALVFGLMFELPLVMLFLGKAGLLTTADFRRYRRYAILIIFVVAAVATPPDVFSQIALAIPMALLYEIGIILLWLTGRQQSQE